MSERAMPHVTVRTEVTCQSSRNGAKIQLIVIHDTEGGNIPNSSRDLQGLADYFNRLSTQASSHVATDQDGNSARMVSDEAKAWHCSYYNSPSLGIEQIGFATDNWRSRAKDLQLRETARWIALWHRRYGIPIRRGLVSPDGRVLRTGVTQHRRLGNLGGAHHDVAVAYPMTKVLRYAKHYARLQEAD
jgi:N-acetyl-anhydromuramyl-L-alanine amidase AmpD